MVSDGTGRNRLGGFGEYRENQAGLSWAVQGKIRLGSFGWCRERQAGWFRWYREK